MKHLGDITKISGYDAPIVDIKEKDFAHWYRDITEEEEKYYGKTIRVMGRSLLDGGLDKDEFVIGRHIMTCCVDDIQFLGVPCKFADAKKLEPRSWVSVCATISAEKHMLYQGELGPVLTAISVEPAEPADPDVATF